MAGGQDASRSASPLPIVAATCSRTTRLLLRLNIGLGNIRATTVNVLYELGRRTMVPVIAFMNLKGGVGKTTLAANLARAIVDLQSTKILLMDLDSQCNLTQLFCPSSEIDQRSGRSVFQCFESRHFFKQPPTPGDLKVSLYSDSSGSQIDIIYGSFETFRLAVLPGGLQVKAAVQHFEDFMTRAINEYDLIILDTNPSGTFTTLCALGVSNFLVAPVTLDNFSMRGVHLLTNVLSSRFPWLDNPKRVQLLLNRIPRTTDVSMLNRLDREEHDIRNNFPNLASSIMGNRIYESKLLANRQPQLGFVADRPIWPMLRPALAKVKRDFAEAANELLLAINRAFSYAETNVATTLGVMRNHFEEGHDRPLA